MADYEENRKKSKGTGQALLMILVAASLACNVFLLLKFNELRDDMTEMQANINNNIHALDNSADIESIKDTLEESGSILSDFYISYGTIDASKGTGSVLLEFTPKTGTSDTTAYAVINGEKLDLTRENMIWEGEYDLPLDDVISNLVYVQEEGGVTTQEVVNLDFWVDKSESLNGDYLVTNWTDYLLSQVSGYFEIGDLQEGVVIAISYADIYIPDGESTGNQPVVCVDENGKRLEEVAMIDTGEGEWYLDESAEFTTAFRDDMEIYIEYTAESGLTYRIYGYDENEECWDEAMDVLDAEGNLIYSGR